LVKIEDDRRRRIELEAYLDKGRGDCHLRKPEIARLIVDSLCLMVNSPAPRRGKRL
jgi:hypothetical protein